MRQVDQRVCGYHRLAPMSRDAVAGYIQHRLQVAGSHRDRVLFAPAIVDGLHRRSGGVPRLINRVCDRALQLAYERKAEAVDKEILETALIEIGSTTLSPTWDSIIFAEPPDVCCRRPHRHRRRRPRPRPRPHQRGRRRRRRLRRLASSRRLRQSAMTRVSRTRSTTGCRRSSWCPCHAAEWPRRRRCSPTSCPRTSSPSGVPRRAPRSARRRHVPSRLIGRGTCVQKPTCRNSGACGRSGSRSLLPLL